MEYTVEYQTDSCKGPSLTQISQTQGWVEYLNSKGRVYYLPELDSKTYQSRQQILINRLQDCVNSDDGYIGWVSHLAQQRVAADFVMPIFGVIDLSQESTIVQCGNSRLDACIMCGIPFDKIHMIAFSKSCDLVPPPAKVIHSTQQFNDLFGLAQIDYRIVFKETTTSDIVFLNSILRYTMYDTADQLQFFRSADQECKNFWQKFQQENGKFKIQIHGTPETKQYIGQSNLFEIEYIERNSSDWEFSYGMMLGEFNKQSQIKDYTPRLQLWLYDVTEPVVIELMIPWMSSLYNFYKTQNEKAVIIDNFNHASGICSIGNWVQ
jgi:hypothetical protein